MKRVGYITRLVESEFFWERKALIGALVAALPSSEKCDLLDLGFEQPYELRRSILREINRDMENRFTDHHRALIEDLLDAHDGLPYRRKKGCFQALSALYDSLPSDLQREVLSKLIHSKYVDARRKAYRLLSKQWQPDYLEALISTWSHRDFECARLLARHLPLAQLEQMRSEIEEVLLAEGPFYLARLFIRLGKYDAEVLHRLQELDEVSYCYVKAKIGLPISEEEARDIFSRQFGNDG